MAQPEPLSLAAGLYAAEKWGQAEWSQFGRETGTSDILSKHPRLYRSITFNDDDYPDAALQAMTTVLRDAPDPSDGEKGRMDLLVDAMPDLPSWVEQSSPARVNRLFGSYIAKRSVLEIPSNWLYQTHQSETVENVGEPGSLYNAANSDAAPVAEAEAIVDGGASPVSASLMLTSPSGEQPVDRSIFIVHGHDLATMDSVRIHTHSQTGVMPVSLAEEAGRGLTIIEKFEEIGGAADFVIVLLTPDDVGSSASEYESTGAVQARARQNVILELGYFISAVGRSNVVVIDAGVERPSDLGGVAYIAYPDNWQMKLLTELRAVGLAK
jgi:hypothetical protein